MSTDAVRALMLSATAAHKRGDYPTAEAGYRAVLEIGPHPGAAALLSNALLSRAAAEPGLDVGARLALRASALPFARASVAGVDARAAGERKTLLSRYAYFLLGFAGHVALEGGAAARDALLPPPGERAALLAEATEALRRVVALDAGFALGWRNLALALKAAERHGEAEAAFRAAVAASGAAPPWDLLYRHGKALKRCGREEEALARYCDAVEAGAGAAELPLFWLRVALAEAREQPGALAPALADRCAALLARYGGGGSGGGGGGGALGAPPNSYIRKLFDGYASKFDAHLVGVLGYKTPERMRALARATFGEGAAWRACADLGCGTGLAGAAFKGLVRGPLDGCDLSPAMCAEAGKRRGLYRLLEAAEVVEWLAGRAAAREAYDLILSADVLVYIGALEPLFDAVALCLRGGGAAGAAAAGATPPAFIFSTEALLGEEAPGATFELSATGRCRHSGAYIRRLAAERGFAVHAHAREAIRENAGKPVIGDVWVMGPAEAYI
jgi:predicted TPR repeat methyltransferase